MRAMVSGCHRRPPPALPRTPALERHRAPLPHPLRRQLCLIRSLLWKRHCGRPERPDRKVSGVLATAGSSPGSACETESDFQAERWCSPSAPAGVAERGLGPGSGGEASGCREPSGAGLSVSSSAGSLCCHTLRVRSCHLRLPLTVPLSQMVTSPGLGLAATPASRPRGRSDSRRSLVRERGMRVPPGHGPVHRTPRPLRPSLVPIPVRKCQPGASSRHAWTSGSKEP